MSHSRLFTSRRPWLLLGLLIALALVVGMQPRSAAAAPPTDLFLSEYLESQPGNRKAVEIYNGTGASVTLTSTYNIVIYSNGSVTASSPINLTGSIADGAVFVLAHTDTPGLTGITANQTSGSLTFNGNDVVALRKGTAIIDVIGQIGNDPGASGWGTDPTNTTDNTIRRKSTICAGDTNGTDAFNPATEWDGYADGTVSGFGSHTASCSGGDTAPSVTSTTPADNATGVAANATISVTFSETVAITGTVQVSGASSGVQNVSPTTSDNLTFTLDPATDFTAGELVTVTIDDLQVADQDANDPPNNMAADKVFSFTIYSPPVSQCGNAATLIHDVQGNTGTSPLVGSSVTIEGVIVGDFQDFTAEPPNELNGYFVQEEDAQADADPNTSEGVFVFEGANPAVNYAVGDKIRLTGTVIEFGDAPDTLTEITGPTSVEVCSTGNTLPTAASIDLPVGALSDYEAVESMRVTFVDELTVSEIFTLGRFGEVLLSAGGRLWNPTHEADPGAPANAVRAANVLRSITLDDGLTNQNPDPVLYPDPGLSASNTLRGGDTTSGLTGVMHYLDTTEDFRIQPTGAVAWTHANPRPADAPAVGGSLKVVGSNTLNFFTTLTTAGNVCGPASNQECRGANSTTEFTRQRDKLINALVEMDADVFGLVELENNAAADPAGDGTDPVLQNIVNGLNAATAPGTYAFIDTGTIGGDAIKVGLIYKPATVTPNGAYAILDSSVDPNFLDNRNRPVLAQTFEENSTGAVFSVAVAHLKSKGSCPGSSSDPNAEQGDLQGCWNPVRADAAQAIVDWFATDPTGANDDDFLLVGDLNSYAKEDPITVLTDAGYVNLAASLLGDEAYSYVFDGEWGYLDYAIASPSLAAQVAGVAEWHINADEPIVLDYNTEFKSAGQIISFYSSDPFRVSDHDPVLVGLSLDTPDTTAPETTIDTNPPNPSNSSAAVFTFSSDDPDATFECQIDNLGWNACASGDDFGPLTDGSHTFEVRATDLAGNTDPTPASYTWTIDTAGPETTIDSNPPDPSNSSAAVFTFSSDDPDATFECQIDNGGWNACASGDDFGPLTDGSHTFEVRATDLANNTDATPASYTWTIDTVAPDTTILSNPSNPTDSSSASFTFSSDDPDATFECQIDSLGWTVCTNPQDYNSLSEGSHTFEVRATDQAGNTDPTPASYTWLVDFPDAPPVTFFSATTAGTTGDGVPYFPEDILRWNGSNWAMFFDGSAYGLTHSRMFMHNVNALYVPNPETPVGTLISFWQNRRVVPGVAGKVDGMDIVRFNGTAFDLWFDGQDVDLNMLTNEKIDGLHVLDGALAPQWLKDQAGGSCLSFLLISTHGSGMVRIPGPPGSVLKFGGEDVLGFCMSQGGDTTQGKWMKVLDGSDNGLVRNSIDSLSADETGQVLYLTTRKTFNWNTLSVQPSRVYQYDLNTNVLSGPLFDAPANGLPSPVDALQYGGLFSICTLAGPLAADC